MVLGFEADGEGLADSEVLLDSRGVECAATAGVDLGAMGGLS